MECHIFLMSIITDFSIIFFPFFVDFSSDLSKGSSPITGIFSLFLYIIGYYGTFYIKEKKKWLGNILLTINSFYFLNAKGFTKNH